MINKVKLQLRIEDNESDELLNQLINHGKAYLNSLVAGDLDYSKVENETLLLNYVRYAYNDVEELFLENFQDDIGRLQIQYAIEVMKHAP